MNSELSGKVALVTGASRGLGRAIALKLASQGALTALNYISNEAEAAKTLDEITAAGGRAELFKADVSNGEAVKNMFKSITLSGRK
jgi:3-oxoacyl-[acyl-carrier protein] reductase